MVNIYLTKVTRNGTLSACPASITLVEQIHEVLREFFGQYQLDRPYESETELRNTYKGVGIDTPYVGICAFEKDASNRSHTCIELEVTMMYMIAHGRRSRSADSSMLAKCDGSSPDRGG